MDENLEVTPDELIGQDELSALFKNKKEREVASKMLMPLAARINVLANARLAKRMDAEVKKLTEDAKKVLENELEKIRKANTPMSAEDMQKLLTQEYLEFKLKLPGKEREFVLRELPMEIEVRILRDLKKTIGSRLQEFSRFDWDKGTTMIQRVEKLMELIPGALETLAGCVALCLDPFNEDSVDAAWVQKHLSAGRILAIVQAQVQVSRYRDFVSGISQLTSSMTQ